ncbi:hypothetical protein [Rivularia sp. UHCC 0363]|uniref:hypothetical protein n=1 Tax=Rivularia sp. UHCC 0363 TaxID=3110244 RepID=UPI002B212130|nr:hypothetical protein [Rivularia sp. UHCC 0363]MEA5594728.1 hypothetical protein [Rivularia sp. UHCC 0363]
MDKKVQIQEIAITIAAKNFNPTILNPDFLRYGDLIPEDWELARSPVYTKTAVQLIFKNGVGIIAQPNRMVFVEALNTKNLDEIEIPLITRKCIEKLPKLDYQAVGINPRGYVTYDSNDEAYSYFHQTLLNSGEWQNVGNAKMNASLQLAYSLERGQFNLTVNQGMLNLPEDKSIPIVLFSGNFNYDISGNLQSERLQDLNQLVENWQSNLETFRRVIDKKFLQQEIEQKNLALLS